MNWILIAGLVRNPANALRQLAHIRRLMERGLVQGSVFSTWHGEFQRYPEVRRGFQELGTVLIESPQPQLRFPGHILHQSLSLQIGLEYVPDNARVLRIRPDIAPIETMMDDILAADWLTADYGFGKPTAYKQRIWCYAGLLEWPFYLNDILFFGHKPDIERLCRIDLTMEWRYSEIAPEQFYHLGPIAAVNPVLDLYARFQRGNHGAAENQKRAAILWTCDFWYDVLLATAREMLANYCVGLADPWHALSDAEMEHFSSVPLRSIFGQQTATKHIRLHEQVGSNTFHALHWAKAVLEGRFQTDANSERLDDARTRSADGVRANAHVFRDRMLSAFAMPLPTMEADASGMIRRPEKHINVQARPDEYTRRLELGIDQLRQLVEAKPDN
jgi:hypothetical protein